MFDLNSVFGQVNQVPPSAKVIVVNDMFVEDYVGGAELTTQALIDASPFEVFKLRSRDVTLQHLKDGADRFWIFANFAQLRAELIPSIVGNLKYAIIEYDYKYCRHRSPELHAQRDQSQCDCAEQMNGKLVSAFFYGAMHIWWMSELQQKRYIELFPFLAERNNTVLSSVFDDSTLALIKALRIQGSGTERKGWIVLGSNSWIKGADDARTWCSDHDLEHEVVWNVPYEQLLEKLSHARGLVYLPRGGDTCPRLVIEAKLLGCELIINDNVQHRYEEWFNCNDLQRIEEYLYTARKVFWNGIRDAMNYVPSISGYVTTYNCISQGYPYRQCIESMLQFCSEVCVVDGGSTDGTFDELTKWSMIDERLKLKRIKRDWDHPRSAVFDGAQKAEARSMCTGDFCWQMDSDEIVHEDDVPRIQDLCRLMPGTIDIIALPVIEYWGGPDKVRMDICPWKWRISRNKPFITHGIPIDHRCFDDEGNLYASPGTDGCDMIHAETGERLQFVSFYTDDVENARQAAVLGNDEALEAYSTWFNQIITKLPSVFHYSWYDLERKIRLYKQYWARHWRVLYGEEFNDTAENNVMFDVPWKDVTDEMITERAKEMATKLGGWIWHMKWDGETTTRHISVNRTQPRFMV